MYFLYVRIRQDECSIKESIVYKRIQLPGKRDYSIRGSKTEICMYLEAIEPNQNRTKFKDWELNVGNASCDVIISPLFS